MEGRITKSKFMTSFIKIRAKKNSRQIVFISCYIKNYPYSHLSRRSLRIFY